MKIKRKRILKKTQIFFKEKKNFKIRKENITSNKKKFETFQNISAILKI